MVRAFYQESTNTLIVTPYRCGSSNLIKNVVKYELLFLDLNREKDLKIFHDIKKTCKNKIFLWRNPFERLVSFYNAFIFVKNSDAKNQQKLFSSKTTTKNFWQDLNDSFHLIEKNFLEDMHTIPQFLYFKNYDENINSYDFFDIKDYSKWVMLNFADKVEKNEQTFEKILGTLKMSDVVTMIEIKSKVETLYNEDYLLQKYITRI